MNNVIDLMPYIENKRALENFEKADIEAKQALADDISSFSFYGGQFLAGRHLENNKNSVLYLNSLVQGAYKKQETNWDNRRK